MTTGLISDSLRWPLFVLDDKAIACKGQCPFQSVSGVAMDDRQQHRSKRWLIHIIMKGVDLGRKGNMVKLLAIQANGNKMGSLSAKDVATFQSGVGK
jgi:hypothetical protein